MKQETSAFTACPECNFEYVLRVPETGMLGGDSRARRWLRGAKPVLCKTCCLPSALYISACEDALPSPFFFHFCCDRSRGED